MCEKTVNGIKQLEQINYKTGTSIIIQYIW